MKYIIVIAISLIFISCSEADKDTPEEPAGTEQNIETGETESTDNNETDSVSKQEDEELKNNSSDSDKEEFAGSIKYEIVIKAKVDDFNEQRSYQYFGRNMTVYLKDGNYVMNYEGGKLDKIIYNRKNNKQYTKFSGYDSLYVLDCQYDASTVYSKVAKDSDYEILNSNVKYVGIFTNNVKLHYYYDPEYYVDPADFEQHKYGHLDLYYRLAKSPYIYAEQEFTDFKVIFRPIEIRLNKDLDMSIFKVPDMPLKESNINQMR